MERKKRKAHVIAPRPGFFVYIALLPICLVFTQLLRSPASAILFVFLVLLPVLSLIYILIARAVVKVYTDVDRTRTKKGEPVEYEIKLINESPIPFPLVEAVITLPSDDAYICTDRLLRLSLLPLGCHMIKRSVSFPLRGAYDIGVRFLRVSDLLGLFSTEFLLEHRHTVIVYPENVAMAQNSRRSETDLPTALTRRFSAPENSEPSDIREYIPGDPIKNIHWKLSAKSDDIQVKNYASSIDQRIYILCDLSFSDVSHTTSTADKPKRKKASKRHRRERVEQSDAVLSAKSVGDAGGIDSAVASKPRGSDERLEALGLSADDISSLSKSMSADAASAKSNRAARRDTAEHMARIALEISRNKDRADIAKEETPYCDDALSHAGELCADAVIELALSLMRKETLSGCTAAIIYPDPRNDSGIGVLTSEHDIPDSAELLALYTVPHSDSSRDIVHLAELIGNQSNITLRIIGANTDAKSAAIYSSIPAMFGGIGGSSSSEVISAIPTGLYRSSAAAFAKISALSAELSRSGIPQRTFRRTVSSDSRPIFTENE